MNYCTHRWGSYKGSERFRICSLCGLCQEYDTDREACWISTSFDDMKTFYKMNMKKITGQKNSRRKALAYLGGQDK